MALRPRRSALYMPGANARALEKAKSVAADVVIMDLEDAVAPDAKVQARTQVMAAVIAGGFGRREVVVRVNGQGTPWGRDDLAAAAKSGADAVLLPKVETARDLVGLGRALAEAGAPDSMRVWAMIETPLGILNVASTAESAAQFPETRLSCLVLGTNDLVKETRAELDANRTAALYWLSATVTAGKAYGLDVLDGVYNDFKDAEGLLRECRQGRQLGMDGKTVIHPDQIATANQIFGPSAAEIAAAERIIAAFELPENKGRGVITLDGRMVELLHADMARRTVAIARAVAGR
jgi:citrate lyase subunit beta / citryl-CoA lyase